jgi:hypothetical protein
MTKQMKVNDFLFDYENGGWACCEYDISEDDSPCQEGDSRECSECGITMCLQRNRAGTLVWMAAR